MHSRTLVALSVLAAAVALVPATNASRPRAPKSQYVAPAGSGALFLVSGHGWGHGVGMGQWGAEGYALQNYTYDAILSAYYPGTTLGQSSVTKIRVLLADAQKKLTLSSDQPIAVTDGNGDTHTLPAGSTKLTPALDLAVDGGAAQPLTPPLTFAPAEGSTLTLGHAYRGKIVVDIINGKLRAVNILPVEQYLYGVVPAEMPSTWQPAALEAQAVASRSYAIASRRVGGPFDVYADTRSQVYLGVSAETPEATEAVDATAGQVVLYNGQVATTFFSSSTGGWTQSASDAWGTVGAPYLVSVRDPYDGISPYHNWGPVAVTGATLAKALGISGSVVDATVTRNASRRVADLNVTSVENGTPTVTPVAGGTAATKLDLRSTWFSVAILSLDPPPSTAPVTYGTSLKLTGIAHGVSGVQLEQSNRQLPWTTLMTVKPNAKTGAFSVAVKPTLTTDYRLATSADAAGPLLVRVMPRVRLSSVSRSAVSGRERPALPGARVLVEQQLTSGSQKWTTVAQGTVGTGGLFAVDAALRPGAVRVLVAPGKGWSRGASTAATVQ